MSILDSPCIPGAAFADLIKRGAGCPNQCQATQGESTCWWTIHDGTRHFEKDHYWYEAGWLTEPTPVS